MSFIVIIPARYFSNRLPKKPLIDLKGKPMVIRTIEKALTSSAKRVIIATDHEYVLNVIQSYRYEVEVLLTNTKHNSGTERLSEVIYNCALCDNEVVVNLQVDEPLIPSTIIDLVANSLFICNANIATLATPITSIKEFYDVNVVKVVVDRNHNALYFSRAPIPWNNVNSLCDSKGILDNPFFLRHVGIYAYYAGFVKSYVNWPESPLEKIEMLEQLRVMWHGEKIYVNITDLNTGISIDTYKELYKARSLL